MQTANPDKWLAAEAEAFTVSNDVESRTETMIEACAQGRSETEYNLGGYDCEQDWFAIAHEVIVEMNRTGHDNMMRADFDIDVFLARIGWLMVKSVSQRIKDVVELLDAPDEEEF